MVKSKDLRLLSNPCRWGENGSSYCHVTGFQALADCLRGDSDAALQSLLPFHPALGEDQSWLEPYAFTNMFLGPQHARPGATFKGWITGTVPWALRALSHHILGIRPEFDGLTVAPCFPSAWPLARVARQIRNTRFEIEIRNPPTSPPTSPPHASAWTDVRTRERSAPMNPPSTGSLWIWKSRSQGDEDF